MCIRDRVVVLDRSEEAGKALVDSIKAEGNEAMFLYTDVMDKDCLLYTSDVYKRQGLGWVTAVESILVLSFVERAFSSLCACKDSENNRKRYRITPVSYTHLKCK